MRLRNNRVPLLLVASLFITIAGWVLNTAAQNPAAGASTQKQSSPASDNSSQPSQDQPKLTQPRPDQAKPDQQKPDQPQTKKEDQPDQDQDQTPAPDSGVFVFKKEVEEVVVHATVSDDKGRLMMNLDQTSFKVFENNQLQTITSFRREDLPVAMGIVIDNSGSMREKRDKVNKAALNLVRSSNPQDQVFLVNFNDEFYLDQPFTGNIAKLREKLEKVEARGGTALYDATVASATYMKENARQQKKVLFVVTDGDDNASRLTLEQAIRDLQEENGPTVYAIGLLGEERARRARRALETISQRTGGIAFLPKTLDEVDEISRTVAHDIRSQYTIVYKPTTPKTAGGYRAIRVEARAKGDRKLVVRTRSGYYPGRESSP